MNKPKRPVRPTTRSTELLWPDRKRGPWSVSATFTLLDGRPECVSLTFGLKAVGGSSAPVQWTALRAVNGGELIDALRHQVLDDDRAYIERVFGRFPPESRATLDRLGVTRSAFEEERPTGRPRLYGRDHFEAVAAVYRQAHSTGKPTQAVAEHFSVSSTTAAKWVARCRSPELKLLGAATPGKAGGVTPIKKELDR